MLRRLFVYHEIPDDWLRTDSPLSGPPGEELSTWLMEPAAVGELVSRIRKLAKIDRVIVRSITHVELTGVLAELTTDTMLWNITDGCLPFHGSYVPAAAALLGLPFFGNVPFVQMLGQDKFKFYCYCTGIGISAPRSILVDQKGIRAGGQLESAEYFVKPNALGNSIGIDRRSRFSDFSAALNVAMRLARKYRCEMLVQDFIEGMQYRSTFIDHVRDAPLESKIRVFRTKRTGVSARLGYIPHTHHGLPLYEKYIPIEACTDQSVLRTASFLVEQIPLKDYGSFDIIVDGRGVPRVIDFNPCPFLDNDSTCKFLPDRSLANVLWTAIKRSYEDQTKASRVTLSTRGALKSQK
jgi:hypothetical protein